ncbi:lipoyltransferase and lipoate-protein ligase [Streptococcus pneumoniae]|nr:lipoyltransferase and lipoate-protein ligase [Streptococcus pneumoniae]
MKYIINHSNDTAFNIALEEYAFKHLLDEDQKSSYFGLTSHLSLLVVTRTLSKKSTVIMFAKMVLR